MLNRVYLVIFYWLLTGLTRLALDGTEFAEARLGYTAVLI